MQHNYGLDQIIQPEVTGLGYEYVGTEYICGGSVPIVRVYVDSAQGVNLDVCQAVSKQLNAVLTVEISAKNLSINKDYTLEVSSPGLNRKIFTPEQGRAQVGKKLKLTLKSPRDLQKRFVGTLVDVVDSTFVLLIGEQNMSFDFSEIEKAQVVPEWS